MESTEAEMIEVSARRGRREGRAGGSAAVHAHFCQSRHQRELGARDVADDALAIHLTATASWGEEVALGWWCVSARSWPRARSGDGAGDGAGEGPAGSMRSGQHGREALDNVGPTAGEVGGGGSQTYGKSRYS